MSRNKADGLAIQLTDTENKILESRQTLQNDLLEHSSTIITSNNEQHANTQSSILLALSEAQSIEIHILQSLHFSSMDHRRVEIHEAHQKTFRWVFDEYPDENCPWSNFVTWLKEGSGLYWINGKAGSGKSTLMRYIFDNKDTDKHLRSWARGSHLDIGGFFFWNSGSPEQRSQAGFLRSLLHQALHCRPDLVRHVFPDEWGKGTAILARKGHLKDYAWPLSALKVAFQRWVALASTSSKHCFFIDGLDEYDGDHEEIAQLFRNISSSSLSHVKVCVSSRPWVVFDEAFKGIPGLRLQDITHRDIKAYVDAELQAHPRMLKLRDAEPKHANELVEDIVTKASGVFLWVTLVVRSLLSGLLNRDGIEDLRRRVRHLPSDISSLYRHMLTHVEPLYREQTARSFRLFEALRGKNGQDHVLSLELELAISASPQQMRAEVWGSLDVEDIRRHCESLDTHLKSRCAGLLEMHIPRSMVRTECGFQIIELPKVNYLHSTVKEFLETDDGVAIMAAVDADFDSQLTIAMSYVTRIKRSIFIGGTNLIAPSNENIWGSVVAGTMMARAAKITTLSHFTAIVDELGRAGFRTWDFDVNSGSGDLVLDIFCNTSQEARSICDRYRSWNRNALRQAIFSQLTDFVMAKVTLDESLLFDQEDGPLLMHALTLSEHYFPSEEMVQLLLHHGANPNQLWHGSSPWQHFLTNMHSIRDLDWLSIYPNCNPSQANIFKWMLRYGASPYTTCTHNHLARFCNDHQCPHSVGSVISDVFNDLPHEEAALQRFLRDRTLANHSVPSSNQCRTNLS